MSTLLKFLNRNSSVAADDFPLVHTTRAHHIKKIIGTNKIIASECDVFIGDKLNYFFVGRPAYKYEGDSTEAAYWELPVCFIFEFNSINNISRIFPFDSGAFAKSRYPAFIGRMEMSEFNAGTEAGTPSKVIGAFFGSGRAYFEHKPKDRMEFKREFSLGVFDEEVRALHKLALMGPSKQFDDRKFSIEVQSSSDVDLKLIKPMAVIAPAIYYNDPSFCRHVEDVWGAQPISYPIYSLSVSQHFAFIYERVDQFYKNMGL